MKSFLFLQGCTCPFFTRLGDGLRARGHEVARVNFNCGDELFWGRRPAWNFREEAACLPDYLRDRFQRHGFTDVIMLGDTRPVHRPVGGIAAEFGARVHVYEEGYFRPNWLTLERGGINGHSRLPRDPEWYLEVARRLPQYAEGERVYNSTSLLALFEVAYHLPNVLNPWRFPGYRTHRPVTSEREFLGWGRRFATLPFHERRDRQAIARLLGDGAKFYLLPLQLDSDSQITHHSPFAGVHEVIDRVFGSFAGHAPRDARLVIKNHPLDTGLVEYRPFIRQRARELGLEGRVLYLETGHLPTLLAETLGVVTVNSTVGTSALAHGCPLIALGEAIYDMPGLTFQDGLDRFWGEARAPSSRLYQSFRNTVIHTTQVNGGFYSREGVRLAVDHSMRFLEPDQSPLEELLA